MRTPATSLLLLTLSCLCLLLLPACATGGGTSTDIDAESLDVKGVPNAAMRLEPSKDGYIYNATGADQAHFAEMDVDGLLVLSRTPAGAAHIGPSGVALSNAANAEADEISMEFITVGEKQQIKTLTLKGFVANISDVLEADAKKWDGLVAVVTELELTDRAQFEDLMETVQTISPAIFDALMKAISPVP